MSPIIYIDSAFAGDLIIASMNGMYDYSKKIICVYLELDYSLGNKYVKICEP